MITEERGREKGERNMLSFPETKVHSAKGKQPAAILIGNHTKKGWRGGQTQHWAACWQHTGFRDSGQLDAVSPTSPELWLEDCIRRMRHSQRPREKKQLGICCPRGPEAMRGLYKSGGIWEFLSLALPPSPLCWKGQQQPWGREGWRI